MKLTWCCGYPLETGVRILAWTDIFVEIFGMAANIESLVTNIMRLNRTHGNSDYKYHRSDNMDSEFTQTQAIIAIVLVSAAILIHFVELLLVNLLMTGANEKNSEKCNRWNIVTTILTVLDGALFIGHLVLEFDIWLVVFMVFNVIYKSYSVGAVNAYRKEMETYGNIDGIQVERVINSENTQQ